MFTPENDLEQAMTNAASDPATLGRFYQRLLKNRLIALGSVGETIALETVKTATGIFHPVFTSASRLMAFRTGDVAHFEISGRELLECTRGAHFVINPRSPLAKALTPDEIASVLDYFCNDGLTIYRYKVYPTKLVKALCILFTSRSLLQTARFAYANRQGAKPHLIIGVEADGDISQLKGEIFAAARVAVPEQAMEVVQLTGLSGSDPLSRQLVNVPPFFQRTARLDE